MHWKCEARRLLVEATSGLADKQDPCSILLSVGVGRKRNITGESEVSEITLKLEQLSLPTFKNLPIHCIQTLNLNLILVSF